MTGVQTCALPISLAERDASDNTVDATCYNGTAAADITCTGTTGVDIDNTIPVISGCTIAGNSASNTTANLGSTVTTVCTIQNATSCNVYWRDTTANAMSTDYSDVDCTYTATSSYSVSAGASATCILSGNSDSVSTWYYDCTDGTNTTISTHYEMLAEGTIGGSDGGPGTEDDDVIGGIIAKISAKPKIFVLFGLGAIMVVLLLLFAITQIRKKK